MDEYDDIYDISAEDDWMNGAYTEDGDEAVCDRCGEALHWNLLERYYECDSCGQVMDRAVYFNHIGASPPGEACITCNENYPFCKKYCLEYEIDPNDPKLT